MAQRWSRSSSLLGDLRTRELDGFRVPKIPYLGNLSSESGGIGSGVLAMDHFGAPTPPLAVSFCKNMKSSHLLAVSDEDGYVNLFDTRRNLPSYAHCQEKSVEARVCDWVAHNNAIFDLCWTKDDKEILTASGDQTIKLWSVEAKKCIAILKGHSGSVKSLCLHSSNPDLLVSGSRDGSFLLWDLRCWSSPNNSRGEARLSCVSVVKEAHSIVQGKRVRQRKAALTSITSVLYLKDEISVASAGAVDSVVKFWDTRNLKFSVNQTCPHAEPSTSKIKEKVQHGISCLSQDSSGSYIASSCMDNRIYLYDVFHLDKGPVNVFSGSKIESFFVKSAISPDGTQILGGSGDGNTYIWQVKQPGAVPVVLKGHEGEVTAVDWCSSEFGKIATSSDDFMVRVWNSKTKSYTNNSPTAVRKRVTAPNIEGRRLFTDESATCSTDTKNIACSSKETSANPSSPVNTITQEFSTPESGRKRNFGLLLMEGVEMQKSPEAPTSSPSSVLNPPPSLKRRTIRDYFLSTS